MKIQRPCIVCGTPTTETRCPKHRIRRTRASSTARGYDQRWRTLSEKARKLQPWCTYCGAQQDLTADHSPEAWRRRAAGKSIRLVDILVLCRPCNSKKGAARDPGEVPPSRHAPDSAGQTERRSLTPSPAAQGVSRREGRP